MLITSAQFKSNKITKKLSAHKNFILNQRKFSMAQNLFIIKFGAKADNSNDKNSQKLST